MDKKKRKIGLVKITAPNSIKTRKANQNKNTPKYFCCILKAQQYITGS